MASSDRRGAKGGAAAKRSSGRASSKKPVRGGAKAPARSTDVPVANALVARVDGRELPEAEARALWAAFSEAMESSRGDLTAFARTRGFASAAPVYERGRAVLVVSTNVDERAATRQAEGEEA